MKNKKNNLKTIHLNKTTLKNLNNLETLKGGATPVYVGLGLAKLAIAFSILNKTQCIPAPEPQKISSQHDNTGSGTCPPTSKV